jgi:acetyl coenzyme A synthetase (ADP forming)-like protein
MADFFSTLSEDSRQRRFFSIAKPPAKLIESFCDDTDFRKQLCLVVVRSSAGLSQIIATANYVACGDTIAEIAMAVDDKFQGKGIGSLLLERLSILAARNGFLHFWAVTIAENKPMLDVFLESGFECRSRSNEGYVEIDLSVIPSERSVARAELRDRVATQASLLPFFQPSSVAVVGASRRPGNIGNRILNALVDAGFKGAVYPVNPQSEAIGVLKTYPNLSALPLTPDLVVIAVPVQAVASVVDECAGRGVRAVVVITAGFAEIGADGRERQRSLLEKVRGYGMRMVGPNCLGILNTDPSIRLNASFAPDFPPEGNIAFCSQSGALGLAVISLARDHGLGLASFVSVGNKADISSNDLLQYWEEDPRTGVILLYLESFGNPRRFARIARRIGRLKPIVAVKAGRSGAGRRGAGSHTAALAADDVATEALFQQTGVIRADTLGEMFDLAAALSTQPLPRGRHVAVLTNAGGLGILCADACDANGLTVQELADETKKRLREFLPPAASVGNPVDMIASAGPQEFRKAADILLHASEVDALIVLTINVGLADLAEIRRSIYAAVQTLGSKVGIEKPVLTCIMGREKLGNRKTPHKLFLPNCTFPEDTARVLGKMARYSDWRARPVGVLVNFENIRPRESRTICKNARLALGAGWLSAEETRKVLSAFALPIPPGGICATAEEAVKLAVQIGFPVALKLASRTIVHKTEFGGVRLNLSDETAVRLAFDEVRRQVLTADKLEEIDGVLIEPMVSGGVEVMIGMTLDPLFGPLIGFGLGGIHVEILRDVCFRVTPITDLDAAEMVRAIKGYPLLQGYRGYPPADIPAIEELLLRVARLVEEVPEIVELDLNPVIALPPGKGCQIVDARIRV